MEDILRETQGCKNVLGEGQPTQRTNAKYLAEGWIKHEDFEK